MEVVSSLDYLKFLIMHRGRGALLIPTADALRPLSFRYAVFLLLLFVLSNRKAIKIPQHRITAVEYPRKTLLST